MRLLNLAEAWIHLGYGPVELMGTVTLPFVAERLDRMDVRELRAGAEVGPSSIHVVDSYDQGVREVMAKGTGLSVLVDELGHPVPDGYDVIWNPTPFGSRDLYPGFRGPVVTGSDAVPVRSDIPPWKPERTAEIGVLIGGGETPGVVRDALIDLGSRGGWSFCVAGGLMPNEPTGVDPNAPWISLSGCSAVLVGAGTSLWEAACCSVPVVVLVTAENQRSNAEWARSAAVPVVDALGDLEGPALAEQLASAVDAARPLPTIGPGTLAVARRLKSLALGVSPAFDR